MASERAQRQIDRLLDEAEDAVSRLDWGIVRDRAQAVLAFDPENSDGLAFLAAAERAQANSPPPSTQPLAPPQTAPSEPPFFANGRYQVQKFLGEGGKQKFYLAHTLLDRKVAFALINTEGLDETSRTRIQREAQTMGKLDQAAPHFENALAFCRKAGYRPELAWDLLRLRGHALDPSTSSGRAVTYDRAKAMSLLDESLAISSELVMRPLMERVLSRREILGA